MKKIKNLPNYFVGGVMTLLLPGMALADWSTGLLNAQGSGLPQASIAGIIYNIMQWILSIIGVIAVIAFVIAGIIYLTSAGDEDRIQQAKRAMLYSIVGVIVALMGLVILYAVDSMLDGFQDF